MNKDLYTIQTRDGSKIVVEESKFIILEKFGNAGDLKILPRVFDEKNEAIKYVSEIEESIKNSKLNKKSIHYFVVKSDEISFP